MIIRLSVKIAKMLLFLAQLEGGYMQKLFEMFETLAKLFEMFITNKKMVLRRIKQVVKVKTREKETSINSREKKIRL